MRQEPILMRERRYNYMPLRFLHRGVERRVRRVQRVRGISARWWRRPGHLFRVECQDGAVCELFHDVTLNAWFIRSTRSFIMGVVRSRTFGKGKLRWTFT